MSYYIGLDTSTTSTKALLMDADGSVVGIGRSEYDYDTPQPLWAEQAPELWWQATIEAIRQALAESGVDGGDVSGIGMTGQMHGLVLLDDTGEVLRPSILWNDQRTQAETDDIRDRVGRSRLIEVTGNDAMTGFTAPKILWVRNNEPEIYSRVAHVLLPKDYVRLRLTGEFATDKAGASGTLLFDLAARDWSQEMLDALDIPLDWLPTTHEGPEITGALTEEAAQVMGLRRGTPVMAGGGDQAANGVGVGAVTSGVVAVSIGTSGVVFAAADRPIFEPEGRLHAFCHAVPDTWHLMGVMLSAAGSYRWFRDTVAPYRDFSALDEEAAAVPPGANGLVFLPYLTGERTPHSDPMARGAFVGLTVRHGLGHLARAVMEGVAFGLRDSVELMAKEIELGEARASGGGARSDVWVRIITDILDRPVRVVGTAESAAHGAAILAATGDDAFASVAEASQAAVTVGDVIEPTPDAAVYEDVYAIYRNLYPKLGGSFRNLGVIDAVSPRVSPSVGRSSAEGGEGASQG
ncbi:MAG: xylulokinase [Acidobacteria bacterium]|nr:xylulokinase [Acidobacteriota bacterium]